MISFDQAMASLERMPDGWDRVHGRGSRALVASTALHSAKRPGMSHDRRCDIPSSPGLTTDTSSWCTVRSNLSQTVGWNWEVAAAGGGR